MVIRIVSFSELQTARQCPLKHQLSYAERWTKDPELMSALSKGTAWHLVLEEHYRELKHHQDAAQQLKRDWREELATIERLCRERVASLIEDKIAPRGGELADLIRWMYEGFLAVYGLDDQWRVLAVEHQAVCRLPTPSGTPSQFKLKMKIDLIVGQRLVSGHKRIVIVDHKSCRNLPKDKELDLDDQFGLYTWGMRQIGKKVFGQIHDAARTERLVGERKSWDGDTDQAYYPGAVQPLEERFKRTPMYRTDEELNVIAVEAYLTAKARYQQQREADRGGYDSPRHTDPQTCRYLCLVEGQPIDLDTGVQLVGAIRRPHQGTVVTVRTANGKALTSTPEHPVLTPRGWVPLGDLAQGDDLFGHGGLQAGLGSGVAQHVQHRQAPIEQVFDAAMQSGSLVRVSGRGIQLYGHTPTSEVEIVRTFGSLPLERVAQPSGELILTGADPGVDSGSVYSFDQHLFSKGSEPNSTQIQILDHRLSGYTECACHSGDRHATDIEAGRLVGISAQRSRRPTGAASLGLPVSVFGIQRNASRVLQPHGIGSAAQFDSGRGQPFPDGAKRAMPSPAQLANGQTGRVQLDKIVSISHRLYSGWVFDLSTTGGWFSADSIVTRNCDFTDPCLAGRKGVDLRDYLQAKGFQQDFTRH